VSLAAGYGQLAVTFPITFPNACFQVVITDNGIFQGIAGGAVSYAASAITPTGFLMTAAEANMVGSVGGGRYLAIGW
jgi:hypothetical protein